MWNISSFLLVIIVTIAPQDSHQQQSPSDLCKKSSERYFKKAHKISMECHAEVNKDGSLQEQFEKIGCTVKCLLVRESLLTANFTVSEDFIKANYKGRVTPEYDDKLLAQFLTCVGTFGSKLQNNDDDKCTSYRAYGLCVQEAVSHVCDE